MFTSYSVLKFLVPSTYSALHIIKLIQQYSCNFVELCWTIVGINLENFTNVSTLKLIEPISWLINFKKLNNLEKNVFSTEIKKANF